ncbi:hypothetical protein G5I_03736 [Acromyrmex echinatior]|uniref:Uncharacterized protein n=1 Tax=Acromyrmex echinatior TaxID=103372 RepID=F4WDS2_ACREC|nr:hypothetical protein G5I_03736 [Acromyrmex echinatior]
MWEERDFFLAELFGLRRTSLILSRKTGIKNDGYHFFLIWGRGGGGGTGACGGLRRGGGSVCDDGWRRSQ